MFAIIQTAPLYNASLQKVLESLEQKAELTLTWFKNNYLKLNRDKCYLMNPAYKHKHVCA